AFTQGSVSSRTPDKYDHAHRARPVSHTFLSPGGFRPLLPVHSLTQYLCPFRQTRRRIPRLRLHGTDRNRAVRKTVSARASLPAARRRSLESPIIRFLCRSRKYAG